MWGHDGCARNYGITEQFDCILTEVDYLSNTLQCGIPLWASVQNFTRLFSACVRVGSGKETSIISRGMLHVQGLMYVTSHAHTLLYSARVLSCIILI